MGELLLSLTSYGVYVLYLSPGDLTGEPFFEVLPLVGVLVAPSY